ncbi:MAG: hypothetical protein J7K40_12205 [candidate division Zixibacteria bacterium]|nr:hypothetical protein [candidate division Zixibacteria bacterium]
MNEHEIEKLKLDISWHFRRKESMRKVSDRLEALLQVTKQAIDMVDETEHHPCPRVVVDNPILRRVDTLYGNQGECPICGGEAKLETLIKRRDELHNCLMEFAKAIRKEDESIINLQIELGRQKRIE